MRKKLLTCVCLLPLLLLLWHCSGNKPSAITQHAFYYWETHFNFKPSDQKVFDSLQIKKLYLRLFDVDLSNGEPSPRGWIYYNDPIPPHCTLVPVVFITNHTIHQLDSNGIRKLSLQLLTRVLREIKRTHTQAQVNELQLDCDWTNQTKDKYFYLLQEIKRHWPHTLSATIRLHQYKYHQRNTPPVDKGVLMCYNVNDVTNPMVNNSLFDEKEVMKYIKQVNYPLPLDLAMPAFSWGVQFSQSGKFEGFWGQVTLKQMQEDTNFAATAKPNVFVAKHNVYQNQNYLNEGALIRVEEPDADDVKNVIRYLKNQLNNTHATLILFQYHSANNTHENTRQIQSVFDAAH